MHPDADKRAALLARVVDARLSAEETTALEVALAAGADLELSLDLLIRARELESACRDR